MEINFIGWFLGRQKKRGLAVNCFASPHFVQDMGEEFGFGPNSFPQKGGEKVLEV